MVIQPTDLAQLSELVRSAKRLNVLDAHAFRRPQPDDLPMLSLSEMSALRDVSAADQVAVADAGITVAALNERLRSDGQVIPWCPFPGDDEQQSLATAIALDLPHLGQATYGSWREWVLGLTVVQADGTVVHCGSRAVKNVAGYDVQRLLVGSRGTFAVIAEVILRTFPLAAFEPLDTLAGSANLIQRCLPTDFDRLTDGLEGRLIHADSSTSTVYGQGDPVACRSGWWMKAGEYKIQNATQCKLIRLAKQLFDPGHKLNPAEVELLA